MKTTQQHGQQNSRKTSQSLPIPINHFQTTVPIITKNTHHESNGEQSETDTEQTPLIETTNEEHLPTKESNEVNNEDLDQNSNLATQQKSI